MRNISVLCVSFAIIFTSVSDRADAQNSTRNLQISYYDHTGLWVLGQSSREVTNGIETGSTTFDPQTAAPIKITEFGRLYSTFSYHADGAVAAIKDGAGNSTQYASWVRGVPQSISYADGRSVSALVNEHGWITRTTDESGNATSYSYDNMGRVTQITHPVGDSVNWSPTSQVFEPVSTAEHGIDPGHWRQTVVTGHAFQITYFDALWRPLLVWEYDASRVAETQRYNRFAYDSDGRTVFVSYPSSTPSTSQGTWTEYDPIGRVVSSAQDSEHGLLVTTTGYGSDEFGSYSVVTQPGGIQTKTWYRSFSEPVYDTAIRAQRADGSLTIINRDIFGKPNSIIRR